MILDIETSHFRLSKIVYFNVKFHLFKQKKKTKHNYFDQQFLSTKKLKTLFLLNNRFFKIRVVVTRV